MEKHENAELLFEVIKKISAKMLGVTLRSYYGFNNEEIQKIGTNKTLLLLIEFRALISAQVDILLHQMGENEVREQYLELAISELMETGENKAKIYEEIYVDYAKQIVSEKNRMFISETHQSRISSILENGRLEIIPPLKLDGDIDMFNKTEEFMLLIDLAKKATVLCFSGNYSSVNDIISAVFNETHSNKSAEFSIKKVLFAGLIAIGIIIFSMKIIGIL